MEQMTDFGWFLVGLAVFVVLAALLGLIKLASMATQWIEERPERAARAAEAINQAPGVSRFVEARSYVLSSEPPQPSAIAPSGLQTDGRQTDRPAERPKPTDAEVLTLFTVFKEAGYNRDEARAILRPFGVAVDNNLYSQAKGVNIFPPGDPTIEVGAPEPLVAQPAGR